MRKKSAERSDEHLGPVKLSIIKINNDAILSLKALSVKSKLIGWEKGRIKMESSELLIKEIGSLAIERISGENPEKSRDSIPKILFDQVTIEFFQYSIQKKKWYIVLKQKEKILYIIF